MRIGHIQAGRGHNEGEGGRQSYKFPRETSPARSSPHIFLPSNRRDSVMKTPFRYVSPQPYLSRVHLLSYPDTGGCRGEQTPAPARSQLLFYGFSPFGLFTTSSPCCATPRLHGTEVVLARNRNHVLALE